MAGSTLPITRMELVPAPCVAPVCEGRFGLLPCTPVSSICWLLPTMPEPLFTILAYADYRETHTTCHLVEVREAKKRRRIVGAGVLTSVDVQPEVVASDVAGDIAYLDLSCHGTTSLVVRHGSAPGPH